MKTTGIILIFFAFSFIGVYFSNRLKKRVQILLQINSLIESCKILIEAQSFTVEELFTELANEKRLDNFFISKSDFLSPDYKKKIKESCERNSVLTDEDKRLFLGFINELGITYLEGQILIINGYIKQFESKITELKSVQASKCKMYNSFGVLIGAFISIILS